MLQEGLRGLQQALKNFEPAASKPAEIMHLLAKLCPTLSLSICLCPPMPSDWVTRLRQSSTKQLVCHRRACGACNGRWRSSSRTGGFKFSTYAVWWIRQKIQRATMERRFAIKIPYHVVDFLRRAGQARKYVSYGSFLYFAARDMDSVVW